MNCSVTLTKENDLCNSLFVSLNDVAFLKIGFTLLRLSVPFRREEN